MDGDEGPRTRSVSFCLLVPDILLNYNYSYGIVGHWKNADGADIAVKQSKQRRGGAKTEAKYLKLFNEGKAPHIIQMIGGPYEDMGQNTGLGEQIDEGPVERIYLEFMHGGEMAEYVGGKSREVLYTSPGTSFAICKLC